MGAIVCFARREVELATLLVVLLAEVEGDLEDHRAFDREVAAPTLRLLVAEEAGHRPSRTRDAGVVLLCRAAVARARLGIVRRERRKEVLRHVVALRHRRDEVRFQHGLEEVLHERAQIVDFLLFLRVANLSVERLDRVPCALVVVRADETLDLRCDEGIVHRILLPQTWWHFEGVVSAEPCPSICG